MNSIEHTGGFLVADARGHAVGHVECPLYSTSEHVPDALAVRSGFLIHRHFLVPAAAIAAIDDRSQVVGLRLERRELRRFL
ncbi:MAG: hypothetical protein ACXVRZ_08830 [Gaiellaceae bacterium]